MTNQTPTSSGVSVLKSLAPWTCYLIAMVINSSEIEGSGWAVIGLWLAGLVLSILFLATDRRNGKAKPVHLAALIAGAFGIVLALVNAVLSVFFVTSVFLNMFRY